MNQNLMEMSKNTTSFYASQLFTDQAPKVYKGKNMAINSLKASPEATLE